MKNDSRNIVIDLFLIPKKIELPTIIEKQIKTNIPNNSTLSLKNIDKKDNEIIENIVINEIKCKYENNFYFLIYFFLYLLHKYKQILKIL